MWWINRIIEKQAFKRKFGFLSGSFMFLLTQFFSFNAAFSQEFIYPLNNEMNLRYEKSVFDNELFFSDIKPYDKSFRFLYDSIDNLTLITKNNFPEIFLNKDLLTKNYEKISFSFNPIVEIFPQYGTKSAQIFSNYKLGASFTAAIGDKIGFSIKGFYGLHSFSPEIARQIDSLKTIPHFGNYLKKTGETYHYLPISAYAIYMPSKFFNFELGVGQHFFGDGHRSLFLSDNSSAFPYLKTTVNIWKIKYLWMFGVLTDQNPETESDNFRSKFLITHYLSYYATPWLKLNFFESIIANPVDSVGISYINPGYFNPVIFLRPVEFSGGSADNAFIGLGFNIKFFKKYQLYGQFVADEFVLAEMKSNAGWWGNKFGFQAGLKIFNFFGIENLFARLEYNQVRPYTYSYYNSFGNYGNHFQPLAHPLGANFSEYIAESHYHHKRFSIYGKLMFARAGMDFDSQSYGQDIYRANILRIDDYGNYQGQGYQAKFVNFYINSGWIINPKSLLSVFITFHYQHSNTYQYMTNENFISFGIKSLIFNDE